MKNPQKSPVYCLLLVLKVHLHHFSKIKSQKEVTKQEELMFSYYFCLMIEGSGSVHLTNGSGSRRPKNIRLTPVKCIKNAKNLVFTPFSLVAGIRSHCRRRRLHHPIVAALVAAASWLAAAMWKLWTRWWRAAVASQARQKRKRNGAARFPFTHFRQVEGCGPWTKYL